MNVPDYTNITRGTRGIFEGIEERANRFCSGCLILLASASSLLIVVALFEKRSGYMAGAGIADGINILLSLGTGLYCQLRKKGTRYRKYALFFVLFIELTLIVSFVDPGATLLYAVPVILAVWYRSVIFTLFVSVINIVFAYFPYIINTYRGIYRLDFIVLEPGTEIPAAGTLLTDAVYSPEAGIDRSATIISRISASIRAVSYFPFRFSPFFPFWRKSRCGLF